MADETTPQDTADTETADAPSPDADEATETPATESTDEPTPESTEASSDSSDDAPADDAPAENAEEDAAAPAESPSAASDSPSDEAENHAVTIEQLLKAGAHFGHLTSRWNPRMEKHIFMDRNNIHIIDLMQTQVLLDKAADAARRFAARGKKILYTGTKKQAADIVRDYAEQADMPFMVDRWLGGTMTNFQTIRRSIRRMEDIERMEKDGTLDKLKKKEKLMRLREHEKLETTLGGIRNMSDLPGALFVVDVKREEIAVSEARKLGIPIIAMVDTNGDPTKVDYPIPANDDALSSIDLITKTITDAVHEGIQENKMKKEASKKRNQSS